MRHLPALSRSKRLCVTALCDTDDARLRSAAARFGITTTFHSVTDLLNSNNVDAVAVCVPPSAHADIACAVLKASKHLYLEKPIADSIDGALRIVAAAEESTCVSMSGFNLRSHALVRETARMISSGELGELRMMGSVYTGSTRFNPGSPQWRVHQDTGGLLQEEAIHHFDLWRYLLQSEVEEVDVRMSADGAEAVALARAQNGVLIHAGFSEAATETSEVSIFGTEALLRLSCYEFDGLEVIPRGMQMGGVRRRIRKAAATVVSLSKVPANLKSGGEYMASFIHRWDHFADCVAGHAQVDGTMQDALKTLKIVISARESAAKHRPVKIV